MKIIPVNEPNGEGNGWDECPEGIATGFELDDGAEVIGFYFTKSDAQKALAKAKGEA